MALISPRHPLNSPYKTNFRISNFLLNRLVFIETENKSVKSYATTTNLHRPLFYSLFFFKKNNSILPCLPHYLPIFPLLNFLFSLILIPFQFLIKYTIKRDGTLNQIDSTYHKLFSFLYLFFIFILIISIIFILKTFIIF